MSPTWKYILRRLLQLIPAVLGITTINFIILNLAPGDAADVLAGESGAATPQYMADVRARFGLDQSLPVQYATYIWNVVRLDIGFSHRQNMPVLDLILDRLPTTVVLMVSAMIIAVTFGVILGIISARFVDTPLDWAISMVTRLAYSVPVFWLALMMVIVFSLKLGWLPSAGFETVGSDYKGLDAVLDVARHMIMPTLVLASFYMAVYARLMRASMLEVYGLDFVRTARAKGLSSGAIAIKHVMRNALLPVVTMAGVQFGALLGGAVVIEQVFALPGIGRLAFDAVFQRDFNLLLSILLLSSILVIIVNLAVDLIYTLIDPRIEMR